MAHRWVGPVWLAVGGFLAVAALSFGACSIVSPSENAEETTTTAATVPTTSTTAPPTTVDDEIVEGPAEAETTTTQAPVLVGGDPVRLVPEIIATNPHDISAFTQGLELLDGQLLEGTGEYGGSGRRLVEIGSGAVIDEVELPAGQFANGLTVREDQIVHLTWQDGIILTAEVDTLRPISQFPLNGEGWGVCNQADRLVLSDGSDELQFLDPETFESTGTVSVTLAGEPVERINELECVGDRVWANVWLTNEIIEIDPATGAVVSVVDASSLVPTDVALGREDVLNGIAHDAEDDSWYVTGKRWPTLHHVRFVPAT